MQLHIKGGVDTFGRVALDSIRTVKPHIKRRWLILSPILLACIALVALLVPGHNTPPPAPVIIMSRPYTIPAPHVGLLDRVMPVSPSWAWLWRIRYALFGRTKTINLNSTIIDFTGSASSALADVLPTNPDYVGSDGLRVWRLREAEVHGLRQLFKEEPDQIVTSSRMATGDKVDTSLYCGNSALVNGTQQQVGLSARVLPSIRQETTDLTAVFCFSEAMTNPPVAGGAVSIQTNFEFAGRFQLPKGMAGLLVLPPVPGSTNHKRLGLFLTSNVSQPKK